MNVCVISMYPLLLRQPWDTSSKQRKETCLFGLAMHLGQAPRPGADWLEDNSTFTGMTYGLTTNLLADHFLPDLPGFLSKAKMRCVFFQSHFLNEILKF